PLRHAFESMSDDEVDAWLAAGEFESVRGVKLPADAVAKVHELVGGSEVEGFTFEFNPGGVHIPPVGFTSTEDNKNTGKGGSLFKYCATGKHFPSVKL